MKKSFFKNKTIFITGVGGFVGSNLAKKLIESGAKVIGLTKNKKISSILFYEKIDKNIDLICGDITDQKLLKSIFSKNKIEICFHLAAQVEVGIAKKNPFSTWETNVRGTYTLMEVIRKNAKNIKSVIIASSDKAYGNYPISKLPYKEDYPLKPNFPYDTSKACADMIALSYSQDLYKIPLIVTRFSNIYGPGQLNFTALIPEAIRACLLNKKLIMRSDGKAIRDFVYISDIVDLYQLLAKNLYLNSKKFSGHVFNVGTNKKYKVKYVIQKIYDFADKKKDFKKISKQMLKRKTSGEISIQYMDYKKAYKFLKWKPKYKLEERIPYLFRWYKNYFTK